MTREETGIIMDILKAAYPKFYTGPGAPDPRTVLDLWAEMFAEDDVALVAAAVKSHIASDLKGYPPHIGAVKNAMHQLTRRAQDMDADKAWSLVRRAASRSAYGAQEEFQRLPQELQRMVGSPGQLFEWSQMDSDVFNSVVASNFRRAYQARQESVRRDALLPKDVKRAVASISGRMSLGAGTDG